MLCLVLSAPRSTSPPSESPSPPMARTLSSPWRYATAAWTSRVPSQPKALPLAPARAVTAQVGREHAVAGVAKHRRVRPDPLARVRAAVDEDDCGPVPRGRVPGRERHSVGSDKTDVRKALGRRAYRARVRQEGVRREADRNDQADDDDERDDGETDEPQDAGRPAPAPGSAFRPSLTAGPGTTAPHLHFARNPSGTL